MNRRSLPRTILPIELADKGMGLQGEIPLADLARVRELLADKSGALKVELRFGRDGEGQRFLAGHLSGSVQLICQRCLQPVELDLNLPVKLGIIFSETAAKQLPKIYEPLIATHEPMALVDIIEEELLLGLPLVAKHPEGKCPTTLPKHEIH